MDGNEFLKMLEERAEKQHAERKLKFDLLIAAAPQKKQKIMIMIAKQASIISRKLENIAGIYANICNENITKEEATEVLEYLQLVESGIVQFMKEKEESR